MDIDSRTKRSLEWERLKGYLAAEACSPWSRELCSELALYVELDIVQRLLDQTAEALSMQLGGFGLSQAGLPDCREFLSRLKTGAQLGGVELLALRKMLLLARAAKAQVGQLDLEDFRCLTAFAQHLHAVEKLVQAIDRVFDDEGNIRDDATPLLRQLRRDVQKLNNQIRDELQRIISSSNLSKALQEPIYTNRNGRYVVPVQASMRQQIPGIVHDSSASGLTVYVEPLVVVELTNKVRLKEADIEREIDRLLSELTELAAGHHDQLNQSFCSLVELDFIAARARLASKYAGSKPELSNSGQFKLLGARHPLLVLQNLDQGAEVVPNDIALGGTLRSLVITGPNTGGKTVFLKTAGLLSLMLRGGLLLPVKNGSSAVIFPEVLADIGDEQSLEQSLSTFSSHMTNIVEIVRRSNGGSLVLLDEVGAGTDPREGAILARVILEHLNHCGALTIATTHYGEMKSLAYTTSGFTNASLDFDEASLSPTYRIRIGVPGSSKAITIAARLGLDARLVEAANAIQGSGQTDIQTTIEHLEIKLNEIARREEDAANIMDRARQLEQNAEEKLAKLENEREKLRRGIAAEMEDELHQAQNLVRSLISELQKSPAIHKAQKAQQDLEVIRQQLGWLAEPEAARAPWVVKVGETVKVRSLNQKAIVESLPEQSSPGSPVLVRAGNIKIKVPLCDIELLADAVPARALSKGVQLVREGKQRRNAATGPQSEPLAVFVRSERNTIDLRGQRVEEALQSVERFVDESFLTSVSPIMIIHGHGSGAVRNAVRQYLSASPYNAQFRPGEPYEGGNGVTVVLFK